MTEQPSSERPSSEQPSTEQPSSEQPSSEQSIDPAILEAVRSVANRFGAPGLEELIREAQRELGEVQAAYERLAAETG